MRSALCRPEGGVPAGTVTVGACPAVPAGERSAVGMGLMATVAPSLLVVVVVASGPLPVFDEVLATLEELEDGEELQAARPSAPAALSATRASTRRRGVRRGMGRDGSRWSPARRGTAGPGPAPQGVSA